MGCLGAMHAIGVDLPADRAIMLGAAMVQELGREEYWYTRFHRDRKLPETAMSMPEWRAIHEGHFNGRTIARSLPRRHNDVVLVEI